MLLDQGYLRVEIFRADIALKIGTFCYIGNVIIVFNSL